MTVTDSDAAANSAGTPTQTLPRAAAQQITLAWEAEDPDGDRLVYNVYFRGEDESQWKLLRANTHDNSITFDADVLADGKYFFRVIASDREANPPASAREATLVSAPVMIDNTPPVLTVGEVRRNGATAHIEWEAVDRASSLRRCEYSLDANSWVPMESVDGVIDSQREKFALDLSGLAAGEHLLVIRAADSANNTGTRKSCSNDGYQMTDTIARFELIVRNAPQRLVDIAEDRAAHKPDPARWSKKEILGHLIDSAVEQSPAFRSRATPGENGVPRLRTGSLGEEQRLRHRALARPGQSLAAAQPPPSAYGEGDAGCRALARVRHRRAARRSAPRDDCGLSSPRGQTPRTDFSVSQLMPVSRREFLGAVPAALAAQTNSSKIDRRTLVTRHNPTLNAFDPRSPLSVGNGEFAFTADPTGLQTFPQLYENQMPLCTQSQWGWHTAPNPTGSTAADLRLTEYDTFGRKVGYPTSCAGQTELFNWLRENPHRLHLGRIGFAIGKPEEVRGIRQALDLWTGILHSEFEWHGPEDRGGNVLSSGEGCDRGAGAGARSR